jgi:hypothetical protein
MAPRVKYFSDRRCLSFVPTASNTTHPCIRYRDTVLAHGWRSVNFKEILNVSRAADKAS